MNNVEVRKGYDPQASPEAPYNVSILIDCSFDDPTKGTSEIAWFATEAEQNEYFNKVSVDFGKAFPKKLYISKATASVYWLEGEALAFAPIMQNGTFSLEDSGIVEEDLVGDEHVYPPETENFLTLSDVFAQARKELA